MLGSLLQFVMFSLAARILGPTEFGFFAFVFSVTSFLAVVGALGQEKLISRVWHEYAGCGHTERAMSALSFATANVIMGALAIAACEKLAGHALGYSFPVLAAAASLTAVQVIFTFSSTAARPIAGLVVGAGLFEVVWRAVVIAVLVAVWCTRSSLSTLHLVWLVTAAMTLSVAVQIFLLRHKLPVFSPVRASATDRSEWLRRSARMWGSGIVEAGTQFADVIIIGLAFDYVAAGAYFAATRIASVLHRVALGGATLGATQVSLLYFHRPPEELRTFIRSLSTQTTVLALAGILGLVVLGKPLLGIFGPSYLSEYPTLLVVASSAFVTAMFCLAPQLLLLTGHEGLYLRVISAALVIRLLLIVILIGKFGTMGAAIALLAVSIFTALALNHLCRSRVGFDASIFAGVWPVKSGAVS